MGQRLQGGVTAVDPVNPLRSCQQILEYDGLNVFKLQRGHRQAAPARQHQLALDVLAVVRTLGKQQQQGGT